MKGYKGFNPGLICKDKQYQENTVFEEPEEIKADTPYTMKNGEFVEAKP